MPRIIHGRSDSYADGPAPFGGGGPSIACGAMRPFVFGTLQ
jgi:Cu/Zn superoxide dismutase